MHGRLAFDARGHFKGDLLYLVAHFAMGAAHETLDREHCVCRVGDSLTLGQLAYQTLSIFGEGHHAGCGASAFGIGYYYGFATLDHRDA